MTSRAFFAVTALASLLFVPQLAAAQTIDVKPYFMLILDTSGSMRQTIGAASCLNSCGVRCRKIEDAKCAIRRVVDATGEAVFGFEQFQQPCVTTCASTTDTGAGFVCNDTLGAGLVRVGVAEDNMTVLESWVDDVCGGTCAPATAIDEAWAAGNTPIAGSLRKALCYFQGTCADAGATPASPVVGDPFAACRPLAVILLTDGAETCGGDPAMRAADLYAGPTGTGAAITLSSGTTINKHIRVYPIGFGVTPGDAQIEAIAHSGGAPDVAGVNEGFYATDEASIAVALNTIIAGSALSELCNNVDDNCNMVVDEGYTKYCSPGSGLTQADCAMGSPTRGGCDQCAPPPEICNGMDDNCDGRVDEGVLNACGACGPVPMEVCDGIDNNCDGVIDEGGVCGSCTPMPEVCNGVDDDCNGLIDDGLGLGMPCGSMVGTCLPGTTMCVAGVPTCVGAVGPGTETCNGLDDDCNGIIDDVDYGTMTCGSTMGVCTIGHPACVAGHEVCVGGTPGAPETCDCTDNDCDGVIDNPPPGGSLCPMGSSCVMCACSVPCMMTEFGDTCPTGRAAYHDPASGTCFCVRPLCDDATCAGETHGSGGDGGVTQCAPGMSGVPTCICKNNECTYPCDRTTCATGTVCEPNTGHCVEDNCRGLGCPSGQVCNAMTAMCVPDPCASVTCGPTEACRAGTCEPSCADTTCASGTTCRHGVCTPDCSPACSATQVCDLTTRMCITERCAHVTCPTGTACNETTGTCEMDPCATLRCPGTETCSLGECVRPMDGGTPGAGGRRVLASGGGGCVCSAGTGGSPPLGLLLLATLVAVVRLRRREVAR